jgi:hypothetical protein
MHRLCESFDAALLMLLLLLPGAGAADEQSSNSSAGDAPAVTTLPNSEERPEDPGSAADAPASPGGDSLTGPEAPRAAQSAPAARAQRRRTRLVYVCRDAPIPVFSDRPCGADANAWRIDLPPPAATGAAPSTRAAAPAAATRPIAATGAAKRPIAAAAPPSDDRSSAPDHCARLEDQLAAINARMRDGYSAREAARLWQRWRDVKAKLRAERC